MSSPWEPVTSARTLRGAYSVVLGTVLGSTLWHSYIGGPVAFKALPRQQFGHLQSKLFPKFFLLQAAASGLLLHWHRRAGKLHRASWNAWLLTVMVSTGLLNLLFVGPWTTAIMKRRHKLERLEGKSYSDKPASSAMTELNKKFGIAHSVSSLANMGFTFAIIAHALSVGEHGPLA
ncbi:hypothetical protein OIO90_002785 [Microbotryomycetes sp. JL221]|nr:hypothetical protein OIO90_002785 [Microbotryomycetes sp. JL221]